MTSTADDSESLSGERACTLTAEDIAALVSGELRGPGDTTVDSVAPIERARPGQLSFLASPKYAEALADSRASIILLPPDLADAATQVAARIIVQRPQEAMLSLLPLLYPVATTAAFIHPTARIGRNTVLGKNVTIEPYAVIGSGATIGSDSYVGANCVVADRVAIGANCRLYPHVTVYSGSEIADRVVLHSGVRIGSDGFGYVFRSGEHAKVQHVGRCIIESDVEIGANSTVDRGSIDDTVVGAGTKIDNLVQVAHNVKIGKLCLIMAQVGIAGSTRIDDGCVIAGQAGIGGHLHIGTGARIAGQAGVFGDVPPGESWSGYPARPHRESLRATAALFKLSTLIKRLERLVDEKSST
ncbi:MAG TPA: UDP-3-O-(3-hydroxymyristoyl)glucosamine N-acyltransferase [Gemmatimonadaceae bacterium]|nr:UDP-3-O-(3-hydroxymyristoyl)glucosamine N-acyltransferase [Gemmatimonadaceae bacterium]